MLGWACFNSLLSGITEYLFLLWYAENKSRNPAGSGLFLVGLPKQRFSQEPLSGGFHIKASESMSAFALHICLQDIEGLDACKLSWMPESLCSCM